MRRTPDDTSSQHGFLQHRGYTRDRTCVIQEGYDAWSRSVQLKPSYTAPLSHRRFGSTNSEALPSNTDHSSKIEAQRFLHVPRKGPLDLPYRRVQLVWHDWHEPTSLMFHVGLAIAQ